MKTINLRLLVDDEVDATAYARQLISRSTEPDDTVVYGAVELVESGFSAYHDELVPRGRGRADVIVRPGFESWNGD